jgi:hypothetical protein
MLSRVSQEDSSGRALDWPGLVAGLLEWPHGLARLAAASCAVVAIAVLVYEVPHAVHTLGREAKANSVLSFADREIAGGNSILVDQFAAYEARGLIPASETFRVVTGPNLKEATPLTLQAVSPWLSYFLMPRRQEGGARWVVCYGCDTSKLGGAYKALWQDDKGISVGTVSG